MKYFSLICLILLSSCSNFTFLPSNGHLLFQSKNKQFSCYTGGNNYVGNCCWPYKEKVMLCTYTNVSGVGAETSSLVIKIVPDN